MRESVLEQIADVVPQVLRVRHVGIRHGCRIKDWRLGDTRHSEVDETLEEDALGLEAWGTIDGRFSRRNESIAERFTIRTTLLIWVDENREDIGDQSNEILLEERISHP